VVILIRLFSPQQYTLITLGWIEAVKKEFLEPTPLRSVAVNDDDLSRRRRAGFKEQLLEKPVRTNASTLYEMANNSFVNHGNIVGMRSRKYLGMKSKRVKEFEPGTIDLTYSQIGDKVDKFGAALRANGMEAAPPTSSIEKNTSPCRMAIYENTWYVYRIVQSSVDSNGHGFRSLTMIIIWTQIFAPFRYLIFSSSVSSVPNG